MTGREDTGGLPATVDGLLTESARRHPERPALTGRRCALSHAGFDALVSAVARGLAAQGLEAGARVAVYLGKDVEAVAAMLGAARAGGVFVPVNPVLKGRQVRYILADCAVDMLVTSPERWRALTEGDAVPETVRRVVLTGTGPGEAASSAAEDGRLIGWEAMLAAGAGTGAGGGAGLGDAAATAAPRTAEDMAAILYTSGSTGNPKGVVLPHRSLVTGAASVADYLGLTPDDRLLAVLPLSFDYGLNQITSALRAGASVVLLDYLFPQDVAKAVAKHRITGLAGVPPLWMQLAGVPWPEDARESLRFFTNSGGRMPRPLLEKLRALLPNATPYLMYGLTEAFRSTYLDPAEVDRRPDSIGKAVPYAEVLAVRPDGQETAPGEPGELVHVGPFVALGYWGDPERTAQRFKPAPACSRTARPGELAVWSGDMVVRDAEGFLTFVGRNDEMIKTSGYRVSPTEVEEALYASGLVAEAVAVGVPDETLGQAIVVIAAPAGEASEPTDAVLAYCRRELPGYMVPSRIVWRESLPRNANGKLDRAGLAAGLAEGTRSRVKEIEA